MPTAESAPGDRRRAAGAARLVLVPAVLLLIAGVGEAVRWSNAEQRTIALTDWLCGLQADWLPFLPWLLAALIFWRSRPVRQIAELHRDDDRRVGGMIAPALAVVSLLISAWTGSVFGDLPPAYHDEFSYLLQAKTFLAGRLSYPSFEPLPELFDQMHVLNEGRFASRYFPGTGLWLAPFVALGHPYWGPWLAGALATFCVYWIGWEIGGRRAATVAGLLSALSPGLALFSNLLLAHHPTLVGLTFFIWMYLRAQRTGCIRDHALGAVGLTFAMLCRPMTAFGVGLPFGAWLLWQLLRPPSSGGNEVAATWRQRAAIVIAWGAPLLCGLGGMLYYNQAITGDWRVSPYQLYTDTYTPRHVFGFHNVTRGEQHLGPKVLENYDQWAEDLTPALAARNVGRRMVASLRWTLGIVPIVGTVLILLLSPASWNRGVVLIASAVVSLHAVHVPYWFEGIMGWHYVFESAPLWLLLVGAAMRNWHLTGMRSRWWGGLLLTAAAVNLVMVPLLWPGRLWTGVGETAFSRSRYGAFFAAAEQAANGKPTIVFVEADPADRHIDYVINDPSLDGPLLIARYRPERMQLDEIRALFPDRQAFLFRAAAGEWRRLP
ncbi:MAG: glycosyltransferase family 39 protein [Planctomycetaceae bacterium]|nr:glycosyltransferase family 39 protein [Planctomycetaceae bacterium]